MVITFSEASHRKPKPKVPGRAEGGAVQRQESAVQPQLFAICIEAVKIFLLISLTSSNIFCKFAGYKGTVMLRYTNNEELLAAIRDGDSRAFEYFFKTYSPRLRNFAMRFIEEPETVADIVQTCFLRIWEQREGLPQVESPQAFLFTIVRNSCLNELRRLGRHRTYESGSAAGKAEELYSLDFTGNPEDSLLFDELNREIDGVMAKLPPRTREIFAQSRFYGKKNREIAEHEGISVKVVERHISKALHAFAGHFGRQQAVIMLMLVALSHMPH